ncbi:unnamed protein product [Scytosiphon promiscuus]
MDTPRSPSRLSGAPPASSARGQIRTGGPGIVIFGALVAVLLAFLLPSGVDAMASNEADDSNNLGLLAQACAENFCNAGVDALDLWLSLEETCSIGPSAQPYLDGLLKSTSRAQTTLATTSASTEGWSPTAAAVVCVGVWSLSIYAGFRSGIRVGTQTKGGYPVA